MVYEGSYAELSGYIDLTGAQIHGQSGASKYLSPRFPGMEQMALQ
jgi:hypothetical protein